MDRVRGISVAHISVGIRWGFRPSRWRAFRRLLARRIPLLIELLGEGHDDPHRLLFRLLAIARLGNPLARRLEGIQVERPIRLDNWPREITVRIRREARPRTDEVIVDVR